MIKIKRSISKQTHNEQLIDTSRPISDKLYHRGVGKKSDSETVITFHPSLQTFQSRTLKLATASHTLVEKFGDLKDIRKFFNVVRDPERNFSCNGHVVTPLGANQVKIAARELDFKDQFQFFISKTQPDSSELKPDGILAFNDIPRSINYDRYTLISGKKNSKGWTYIEKNLKNKVNRFLTSIEPKNEVEGMKIFVFSKNIDTWTRLEFLITLKLNGQSDTLKKHQINKMKQIGQ